MPSLIATLGLNSSRFGAALSAAEMRAAQAGGKIASSLGSSVAGKLAGIASVAGIGEAVRRTVEYGGKVQDLSDRLGISTDAVQSWDYALRQSGSSIDQAVGFFEKLSMARKAALSGDDKMVESFRRLGVTVGDLKSKRVEDLAGSIAKTFQAGDAQALIADLREVGGRGAGEMAAAFKSGLADMVAEAKSAGLIISEEVIGSLDAAGDRMSRLGMEFTASLAPAIAWFAGALETAWRRSSEAITRIVTTLRTGSVSAGTEAAQELRDQYKEQDAQSERTKAAKKKAGGLGGEGFDNKSAIQKEAAERERLATRLADIQNKNYLDSLSKEDRLTALHKQRVDLANFIANNWKKLSEANRLKAEIDLNELIGQEQAAAAALESGKQASGSKVDFAATSAQRIGAYNQATPLQTEHISVARKSEGHLAAIRADIARIAGQPGDTVKF